MHPDCPALKYGLLVSVSGFSLVCTVFGAGGVVLVAMSMSVRMGLLMCLPCLFNHAVERLRRSGLAIILHYYNQSNLHILCSDMTLA